MQYFFNEERKIERFSRMIRKAVPSFDANSDYVLWLVFDLFDDVYRWEISGIFSLLDENDKELDLSLFGIEKAKIITRTPYPNKYIKQIGLQSGNKRVFGVPLVCKDYRNFLKIRTIKVHWNIVPPIFSNTDKLSFQNYFVTLDALHHITFDTTDIEKNHWFTLAMKDHLFLNGYRKETEENYGYSLCMKMATYNDNYELLTAHKKQALNNKFLNVDELASLVEDYSKKWKEENSSGVRFGNWDLFFYYFERSVTVSAETSADIILSECFGFK